MPARPCVASSIPSRNSSRISEETVDVRLKLIVPLIIIVMLPLMLLGWLGQRMAADEQEAQRRQFGQLLGQRLVDTGQLILGVLRQRAGQLLQLSGEIAGDDRERLRRLVEQQPQVTQVFLLDGEGQLRHPASGGDNSDRERAFLRRTESIWRNRELLHQHRVADAPEAASKAASSFDSSRISRAMESPRDTTVNGWYAWHWENGINLLFWWRTPDGGFAGVELDRIGILADIIAALPSRLAAGEGLARVRLVDDRGSVLYQWGGYEPEEGGRPRASRTLEYPLSAWRLEYFMDGTAFSEGLGATARFQIINGLLAVGLLLVGLGVIFYRELSRTMREAAQRVNFVNQVSHELKTPLTNIRMYAELMEPDLEPESREERHLAVIVAESQRLARLIGNILSFARGQRQTLRLHPVTAQLDDCLLEVLEQFRPGLERKGLAVRITTNAAEPFAFDRDAVAQIIGNLFSNVEKYAATGKVLDISTRQTDDSVEMAVQDSGPGIPHNLRQRVFRPFYRVRNDLTEGVSGTGIGLSIARDLARLHCGDLILRESGLGACFILQLPREKLS
ncbi:MAG: HAMP domain-containing histidine kinase [Gammaproteobacteria bacterium]|nr:HAMP domain-containing histidine kinase [Gammaproteobacteria bacterium]